MTRRMLTTLAGLGSAALLAGAFGFQAMGYAPCQMCLWQRWPHAAAVALAVVAFAWPRRIVAVLGALAALVTAGLGLFHTGVERAWWDGPASCAGGGSLAGMGGADLLSTDTLDKVVMCDEVAWAFAGLSMASWNAVLSLGLAAIWVAAARRGLRA
ncbi:disulfide bond formation protein B [Palleronia sediminis]|uniref:Disulfide bond formation protein B n=1 Tax=Palleronia sediminis TaxID=2547833 RepID=A0A4R6AI77_9RHOB|nr:disulfide bond formation protein B [Palleronia sediminis]TDL83640.1 disulfide bond formation protein B [Palleronia sediminis]